MTQDNILKIPRLSLVILIGPSGSGKSTFAARHFSVTEVVSSDRCRGWVSDDENNQGATDAAFEVLELIVRKRLEAGRLTVVDATNVETEHRGPLAALARQHHVTPVAVLFDLPDHLLQQRNRERTDRTLSPETITRQKEWMGRPPWNLGAEGFEYIYVLDSDAAVSGARVERIGE